MNIETAGKQMCSKQCVQSDSMFHELFSRFSGEMDVGQKRRLRGTMIDTDRLTVISFYHLFRIHLIRARALHALIG